MKITISYAQSVDGSIAVANGESRYISEEASLELNQKMRRDNDAILVGIGTVLVDDPLLTCRIEPESHPIRVILDGRLRIPGDSQISKTAKDVPTLVFFDKEQAPPSGIHRLQEKGMRLIPVCSGEDGGLSLHQVIDELESLGINSLLVEGGSRIITAFLQCGLWDEMKIVTVGKIIGEGIPAIGNIGVTSLSDIVEPDLEAIDVIGSEVVWRFKNERSGGIDSADVAETRTVFFTAPKEVAIRTEKLTGKGELFTSRLMALSPGTERQYYLGNFPEGKQSDPDIDCVDTEFSYPFPYGYINVVADVHGACYFGFLPHSEHFRLSREGLVRIPEKISDETALFIPHVETALSIIQDTRPVIGDRVLLVGAGVVGTLTARILQDFMGVDVTVFDIDPRKHSWINPAKFICDLSALEQLPDFDRAIEVSGSPRGLQACIDSIVPEGVITVASWYGDTDISLNIGGAFHWKRLQLKCSQVSHLSPQIGSGWSKERRMKEVLSILSRLPVLDLLTHRFSFSSAPEAFTLLGNRGEFTGLISLVPGE